MTDGIPIVKSKVCTAIPTPTTIKRCGYLDTRIPPLCVLSLNRLRQWMIKTDSDYLTQGTSILSTTTTGIAIQKEPVISVITKYRFACT